MVNVAITGATKGLGKGYAAEFLKRGHNVAISGRSQSSVNAALEDLDSLVNSDQRVVGFVCDVSNPDDVLAFWNGAKRALGTVDIWINNAGYARTGPPLAELSPDELTGMIRTNVTGTMIGARIALNGMIEQGHGHIYNTLGAGSDGRLISGMTGYGSTKRAIKYFSEALRREAEKSGVKVSTLNPGTTITEGMLREIRALPPDRRDMILKPVNIMGDHVSTNTPWLVERILENEKSGANIRWLSTSVLLGRFVKSLFVKRDVMSDYETLLNADDEHARA